MASLDLDVRILVVNKINTYLFSVKLTVQSVTAHLFTVKPCYAILAS